MRFSGLFSLFFFTFVSLVLTTESWSASFQLSNKLIPGSAVLIHVKGFPEGSTLKGDLDKRSFPLSADGLGIIALDMAKKEGYATVRVRIKPKKGAQETVSRKFWISPRPYKEEHITLPKKKVDLGKTDLTRANKETRAIKATYNLRRDKPGYLEQFRQPLEGRFSGVFGSRRILNGKPKRPHNGVDIAAPKGTPIVTTAPGRVVLVGKDYFFTGNTLVIHHGDGVISLYAHMDEMLVEKGEWLSKDTVIGTIGMTGRVTGPHLHWGTLVRGARVDPMMMPGIRQP
ncbi:MAG: M23 family metallopeptidase [Magnetococcales bacterium]|nr:M23 family metallopeptidase [Magnetococcales bacterium]